MKTLIILANIFLHNATFANGKFLPSSFKASFIKKEKSLLSGKLLESKGNLYYKYPGRIRLEEKGKKQSVFVSNPHKTYYYKPPIFDGPGELTISSTSNYPLTQFFDSLNSGLKNNDFFKVSKKQEQVFFSFTKKGKKELKISDATLSFKRKVQFQLLKAVKITLSSGKKLNFELKDVDVNKRLKNKLFTFKEPKNTRVSR